MHACLTEDKDSHPRPCLTEEGALAYHFGALTHAAATQEYAEPGRFDYGVGPVPVKIGLGEQRKLVGREGFAFHQYLVPGRRWLVEGAKEQLKVDGQAVHDRNFDRLGPYDGGHVVPAMLVGRDPGADRIYSRKMPFHAVLLPLC